MLSRHTKRALLGLFFAGAAIVVVGAATRHYFAARALEIRMEEERAALVAPEPMLLTVERSDRARERIFAVTLEPDQRAEVAAEVAGRVEEVLVEEGDWVEEGQIIVRLDATLARLNVASAEAAMESGEAQLRELRRREAEAERLAAAQTIPETQLESARSQAEVQEREVERLRAELNRQEEMLRRHNVRAPFSGHVNQRLVEAGDSANLSQALVSLVTLNPLRARFFVSDLEVDAFRVGEVVRLNVPAYPGLDFTAPVVSVAGSTDPVSGLYLIEARVPNPERELRGGVQGRVRAEIARYKDTLFVPAAAVQFEGNRTLVELWVDGEVSLREIEIGAEVRGDYPVLEGLEAGDVLVVR